MHRVVALRFSAHVENKLPQQLFVVILLAFGVIVGVLVLATTDQAKSQLSSRFGLRLTAITAFSSTKRVANAMAGLMQISHTTASINDRIDSRTGWRSVVAWHRTVRALC